MKDLLLYFGVLHVIDGIGRVSLSLFQMSRPHVVHPVYEIYLHTNTEDGTLRQMMRERTAHSSKTFCFKLCKSLKGLIHRYIFVKIHVLWLVSWPGSPVWCGWTPGWWHYRSSLSATEGSHSNVSTGPWTSLSPSECSHPSRQSCVCYLKVGVFY